jgi:hypothetical protein
MRCCDARLLGEPASCRGYRSPVECAVIEVSFDSIADRALRKSPAFQKLVEDLSRSR